MGTAMTTEKGLTPPGWTRNAKGFDEPPNVNPSGRLMLILLGPIAVLIVVAVLFF